MTDAKPIYSMESFNQNLKQICHARSLSLTKLAKLAKIPRATLHSWTCGSTPNLVQLKKVATVLELPLHQLAFGVADPYENSEPRTLKKIFSGVLRVTVHEIADLR